MGTGTGIFRVKAGRVPGQGNMQFYICDWASENRAFLHIKFV